jgi:hypothetical protein
MRGFLRALAVAGALLLGACAAPEVPFDRTQGNQIQHIGVVTPKFPNGSSVILASTVGQSFGLIGALVDLGLQHAREVKFEEILKQQGFSTQDAFIAKLTATLQAEGYQVSMIEVQRQGSDFHQHYPVGTEPRVDAYLDLIVTGYGYIAAGIGNSTPYRPIWQVRVRLVSAKDSSVLMQDLVTYNPYGRAEHMVTIAPDPAVQYTTFEQLAADPVGSVKGLQNATDQTAETIAKLLQKAP